MAKNDNLTDYLTDLADGIRAKKGTTDPINPQDFRKEIESISGGGGNGESGIEIMYFAAKDGGAMGYASEMAMLGLAAKTDENKILPVGMIAVLDSSVFQKIKAVAIVPLNYEQYGGPADISNPDTLRAMMFQFNGVEGMPEIIEITKEQFYDLNA